MSSLLQILRVSKGGRIGVHGLSAWRPDLKIWHHLFVPLLAVVRLVAGKLTRSRVIQCAYFAQWAVRLFNAQGSKGLVLHLKVAHVMLIKALPGSVSKVSSREIGKVAVSAANGLPRVIPGFARKLIRSGDKTTIRLWLSLFGLYRVLRFSAIASLATITEPGPDLGQEWSAGWQTFVRSSFLPMLSSMIGVKYLDRDPGKDLKPHVLPITKAASNSKYGTSSFGTAGFSAAHWITRATDDLRGNPLWMYLFFLDQVEGTKSLWTLMHEVANPRTVSENCTLLERGETPYFKSGRLHFIPEAAGKVRVVALVDYWTQVALYPLHHFLFEIFREIEQDGTHDQLKPVKALLARIPASQTIYSYDLSAATDRLPLAIQKTIVGAIWSPYFAEAWGELLVGRPYAVPKDDLAPKGAPSSVKYAVGQPMGAYSSWALLALTHHAVVQFAARTCGFTEWFTDYAVLGDDIVIANDGVAACYLQICARLGVKVSIAKSMVASGHTLEFAKRTFFRKEDVSGLPWKLFAVSQRNLSVAVSLLARVGAQNVPLSPGSALLALGGSWKSACASGTVWESIPPRPRALLVTACHPNVKSPFSFPDWVTWLSSRGPSMSGIPKGVDSTWFTPWATGLLTEYLEPMVTKVSELHSAFLFDSDPFGSRNPGDAEFSILSRLADARASALIVKAEDALEKSTKTLQHLQKLQVKFMLHQASAIFTQIVNLCEDRLAVIPRPARELVFQASQDDRPPVSRVSSTWARWRLRGQLVRPEGLGPPGTNLVRSDDE